MLILRIVNLKLGVLNKINKKLILKKKNFF